MRSWIAKVGLNMGAVFVFLGCERPPEFSNIPVIEYVSIDAQDVFDPDLLVSTDSVIIRLNFQDGDGNLGVEASDPNAMACDESLDGKNYIVDTFRKEEGEFVIVEDLIGSFGGVFPPLSNTVGPIEGILDYDITLPPFGLFQAGDTLRFEVFIADNACNRSNTIVTDPVVFREADLISN